MFVEKKPQRRKANDQKFTDVEVLVTTPSAEVLVVVNGCIYANIRNIQRTQPMNLTKFISLLLH